MAKPSDPPSANSSSSFWHSEPSSLLMGYRSSEELPEEVDVVVVGSGISAAGVLWHFLTEGKEEKGKVLVLEAREVCWGATGRNGGHCQPIFYEHPHDPNIGTFELSNYLSLQTLISDLDISCEFHAQKGIRGLYSPSDLQGAQESVKTLQQTSPELARYVSITTDRKELEKLRLKGADGAVVTAVAARMWPYKFVSHVFEELLSSCDKETLNLQTNTPVSSLHRSIASGLWQLDTSRGNVRAKKVVLATNAYTSYLVPSFSDLIVPCRGQMSALLPSAGFAAENRIQNSFGFIGAGQDDYLIQRPEDTDAHLMFGGGRSKGSSLGISDDGVVDGNVAGYLRNAVSGLLTGGEGELEARFEWTGIMGFSRDNLPWVGPVPGHEGVFVVAGYTGHGMPNAWLCGRAIATMLAEEDAEVGVEKAVLQGLPEAYVVSEERIGRARALGTVEEQDSDHMFKAEFAE